MSPRTDLIKRSLDANHRVMTWAMKHAPDKQHRRIRVQLEKAGLTQLSFFRPEYRYLPHIIFVHEDIKAAMYGWCGFRSILLVATDRRLLILNKKPYFIRETEVSYGDIRSVTLKRVLIGTIVTLEMREGACKFWVSNASALQRMLKYLSKKVGAKQRGL